MIAPPLALLLAAHAATGPADLEAAHLSAEAAVRAGDYRDAAARYREILGTLEVRESPDAPWAEWRRALLQLAVVETTLGNGAATRSAMDRVLALDPQASLDPDLFSPSVRKEFEAARTRDATRPRYRLRLTSLDGVGTGWVQGRPLGPVPAEILLPAGSYRAGVESGGRERTVTVDLARDESVIVDVGAAVPIPAPPVAVGSSAGEIDSRSGSWIRPAAWTATGLAVVGAGLTTWQAIAAGSGYSEAKGMLQPDGTLKPGVSPSDYTVAIANYESHRTNAWIAASGTLVLGVGATVLWLLVPSSPVEPGPTGVALRF
ncbi:MAG: tetratricopeptide repeat protein [Deltaproteobacteria bacterium]